MKNFGTLSLLLFALLFVTAGMSSCDKSNDNISPEPEISLTEVEIVNLQFMREEEKLARDVHLYFYDKYELNIFNNIASSEQKHMDAVGTILEKYGVEDPASNESGVFTNATLQQLYDDLIAQGDASLVEALKVGATIEDVDIRDLDDAISGTTKTDLIEMYEMLECGSRNHMRAFSKQLKSRGETYVPQFIAQTQYDEVINGAHEHCGK